MIPIRDTTKSKSFPIVNYILIALCGVAFLFEVSLGSRLELFIFRFGVIPADVSMLWVNHEVSFATLLTLFTSPFLHGGWLHLIGNMLYLYIFGDNVEDRLGHGPYLLFYVLCGIGASIVQVYSNQYSTIPLIGASGAIAGVLGAYFLLYPRARILTLVPLFIFFPVVELSAFLFLGFWFVIQFLQGSLSSGADVGGGVAWWAHAGGFLVGAVLLPFFLLWKRM